jgi:hypothetical protein
VATEGGVPVSAELSVTGTWTTTASQFGHQLLDELSTLAARNGYQIGKQSTQTSESTGSSKAEMKFSTSN